MGNRKYCIYIIKTLNERKSSKKVLWLLFLLLRKTWNSLNKRIFLNNNLKSIVFYKILVNEMWIKLGK